MEAIKNFTKKTFSSLKIRNYRLYFFGQAISHIGTWMQVIAQSWLVLQLTGSGTQLGLIAAAQFLPVLLFGPFAGVIADKYEKRKVLYFTQGTSGLLALLLGLLITFNQVEVWMVFLIAFFMGLLNALDTPTRQTFVYEIVGNEQITNAVSLNGTLYNLTRIIGPSIAGIIIASFSLALCFYLNAISFIAVLIALYLMNPAILKPNPKLTNITGQVIEGFKYVLSKAELKHSLIFMGIIGTFVFEFTVSVPLLAKITFNSGVIGYAQLTSAMGLGAMLGGLYSASRKKPEIKNVLVTIFMLTISMFVISLSPNLLTGMLAMVFVGFSASSYSARGNAFMQLNSAPEMRGRVMSLWNVAFVGSTPIGGPIIGFIGENFSPRLSFAFGGLAALLTLLYGFIRYKNNKNYAK